jgi:hypothetical protein
MGDVRVGMFALGGQTAGGVVQRRAGLARVVGAGIDHVCVGDHVSFFVGAGSDGLIAAASLLSLDAELPAYVGLYLLPLRHPVAVAAAAREHRRVCAWAAYAWCRHRW